PVIEIGVTPNRPDALGVAGIARDLAAAGLGTVKPVTITEPKGEFDCPVDVKLDFPDGESLCPAFGLRLIRGVKNGPSPRWMQQRLRAIGLRPISTLVDITNYVTYDLGRPLHVFDAGKVKGNLVVRRAKDGEEFLALDGKTYTLNREMCVIADENGPESLSGIMGGEHSGCTGKTVDVLVESALWEPLNIARTGRDLGIISDARYRFERGVDPGFMVPGLDHACNLILDLCGGTVSSPIIAGKVPKPDLEIEFPVSEIKRLTSIDIDQDEATSILKRLGFHAKKGKADGSLTVSVPGWRPDVFGKADLVEEVMRIYGVDRIEPSPMYVDESVSEKILTIGQTRDRNAKRALAVRGMLEAVTWSFISKPQAESFGGGSEDVALANPIASDMSHMRPSLLPGLLAAAQRNADRGYGDVAIFEVSNVYLGDQPGDQKRVAGGIRRATATPQGSGRHWQGAAGSVSVYDAKADALAVLEALGVDVSKVQIVDSGPDWYHPGRRGQIQLGPKLVLANFGELHPMTLDTLDVSGPVCGFEVWLDAVPQPRAKATKTKPPLQISDLQAVRRDFAFVLDSDCDASKLLRAASGADKKLITDVSVFDVFEGPSLGEGKKSVAIEVTMQPSDKTLTDAEIDAVAARIVENVTKTTGGVLRG
ncbi:MAG: phenylalanine--tRNA ligase subunit beta, partial [Pseudomonadota bacterium]